MVAKLVRIEEAMEAYQAEALAATEGIKFAPELGIWTLIVEGDARLIFESFNNS